MSKDDMNPKKVYTIFVASQLYAAVYPDVEEDGEAIAINVAFKCAEAFIAEAERRYGELKVSMFSADDGSCLKTHQ